MSRFFDTTESIGEGLGFSHFSTLHLVWLAVCVIVIIGSCFAYKRFQRAGRSCFRKIVAWLLVADELFKTVILLYAGRHTVDYLPFHLCSINIFVITIHAYKPSKMLDNFLYTVCIPGALAAMLFPTWKSLPITTGMHWHSFTVHILLMLYPIVLFVNGDMKPELKQLPKSLGLLVVMAIPIYIINLLLNTNFMFLMSADPGNPLYLFEQIWGNHLFGFPVIIVGVLLVMYGPLELIRKLKKS
jgi:hypothetical integral membrane protein (TIGR02206 family)